MCSKKNLNNLIKFLYFFNYLTLLKDEEKNKIKAELSYIEPPQFINVGINWVELKDAVQFYGPLIPDTVGAAGRLPTKRITFQ